MAGLRCVSGKNLHKEIAYFSVRGRFPVVFVGEGKAGRLYVVLLTKLSRTEGNSCFLPLSYGASSRQSAHVESKAITSIGRRKCNFISCLDNFLFSKPILDSLVLFGTILGQKKFWA